MRSLESIIAEGNKKTREAKEKRLLPYKANSNHDVGVKSYPFLGYYVPDGYEIINTYFVDNSGFGADDEPALSFSQFIAKVKKGKYYAIKEAGSFQVYINEYKKTRK